MRLHDILLVAAAVSLAGCSSFPGVGSKPADEHDAHHAADRAPGVDPAQVDQQMKAMQDMHQKMMDARTPAERAALMKDHMKAMQDGMAMMGRMRGGMPMMEDGKSPMPGGPPLRKDMMQRMDMMEMMMQMMIDREAARPPGVR